MTDYLVLWQLTGTRPLYPTIIHAYFVVVKSLYENRYLSPRTRVPFSTDLRDRILDEYDSDRFKDIIRLTKDQFARLVVLIAPSRHFTGVGERVSPEKMQDDQQRGIDTAEKVALQLKVALFRLGTKGISTKKVAFTMGVSDGAVNIYTWRCIFAIEDLDDFVVWPDAARKRVISDSFRIKNGFPCAIGAVDGVPFPFDRATVLQSQAWITRKMTYAMGATAVCDHEGRFTYFTTRYVGSMHDSTAHKRSYLYKEADEFF